MDRGQVRLTIETDKKGLSWTGTDHAGTEQTRHACCGREVTAYNGCKQGSFLVDIDRSCLPWKESIQASRGH